MGRGFTLVELLVVISIIATLAGVGVPVIISKKKQGDRSEAISNIKQIGMAMFSFDQDYNGYPSQTSAADVETNNPADNSSPASSIPLSDFSTSNGFFCQLIRGGFVDSEKSFYAKSSYTKKPDNVMTTGKALAAGECGFSYVMGQNASTPLTSSGNSGQPLLIAVAYKAPGGAVSKDGTCEVDVYDKKAVVFRIDNSATAENVSPGTRRIILPGSSKGLLDNGADTVWGTGINPTLMVPLPKQ